MFFLRFTDNAQADLERGYSFAGYMLFQTRERAVAEFSLLDGEDFDEDNIAQDNVTGMWGRRLSGLCGFGPFESTNEAAAAVDEHRHSYGGSPSIFEGIESFDPSIDGSDDEGARFTPLGIV